MRMSSRCATALVVANTLAVTLAAQSPTLEQRIERLERLCEASDHDVGATDALLRSQPLERPKVSSKVDLHFWGRANFVGIYDNYQGAGGVGGGDFHTYVTEEGNEELSFTPRDTRIGFAASSKWDHWTSKAVFEIDFYGGNSGDNFIPRMRLGYVEIANDDGFSLRTGQDWIPIAQQNPGSMDLGILCFSGNLWNRVPQLTARVQRGDMEYLFSLLHLRVAGGQDQEERMPWAIGRVAYTFLDRGLIALGAGLRDNHITNASGAGVDVTNHLIAAEARLPITDTLDVTTELWTGAGIGREFLRIGLDYNSQGEEIAGSGGFVSLRWKLTDDWIVNCGVALDQPHDGDTDGATFFGGTTPYDSNRAAFVNVRYLFNKNTSVGLEYTDYQTEAVDGSAFGPSGQVLRGQRVMIGSWFVF